MSLAKAQIQLSVLLADGTHDVCAITSIPQAFAILLDTGIGRKAFLSAKSILKMNTIHPAGQPFALLRGCCFSLLHTPLFVDATPLNSSSMHVLSCRYQTNTHAGDLSISRLNFTAAGYAGVAGVVQKQGGL